MGNPCFSWNPFRKTENTSESFKLENKILDRWEKDKTLMALSGNNSDFFKTMYRNVTGHDFDFGEAPSIAHLKKLDRKIASFKSNLLKRPNAFQKWFYLPEVILAKNPATADAFHSFIISGNKYRGNVENYGAKLNTISERLAAEMQESSLRGEGMTLKEARKEIQKRQTEFKRLWEIDQAGALDYYRKNLTNLMASKEFGTYARAESLFKNPNELKKPNAIAKYGTNLVEAAKTWHDMRGDLFKTLNNGLNKYISMLKKYDSGFNGVTGITRQIEKLQKALVEDPNYLPTQVLGTFDLFKKINETMHKPTADGKEITELSRHTENMVSEIIDSINPSKHILKKTVEPPLAYNKDLLAVLDAYTKNVTRFNYNAFTSDAMVTALKKLGALEGTEAEGAGRFLSNYLRDSHNSIIGMDKVDKTRLGTFARAITAWEFTSKLGFNIRSAGRNLTQSLFNVYHFGVGGIHDTMKTMKLEADLPELVQKAKKEHGVFYVNIEELASPKVGKAQFSDLFREAQGETTGERLTSKLEDLARVSGKPMQWIENKFNRSATFTLGFVQHWKEISKGREMVAKWVNRGREKELTGKELEDAIHKEKYKRSSAFAAEMVKNLHFEYSPFAKPKALRTGVGSILGQFQTYTINSFNRQVQYAKEGSSDVMHGMWRSPDAWRMYRMFLTHSFITGFLSPMFNVDLGFLYQNDAVERVKQFYTFFTGDDEDKKRAFFGKGPVVGTLGGPFISDLINMGQVMDVIKMDEENWMTFLAGYQDFAEYTDDDKARKALSTISTVAHRGIYQHLPKWQSGTSAMTLLANELALGWDTKENKLKRNYLFNMGKKVPVIGNKIFKTSDEEELRKKAIQYSFRPVKSKIKSPVRKKPDSQNIDYDAALAILQSMSQ